MELIFHSGIMLFTVVNNEHCLFGIVVITSQDTFSEW